jgi:hypothetical protein
MADTSWMARVGARLVTNGYAILPIAPGTKKPGQFARAGWHDYPQWNRHASRATTEHEVATWSTWPDCGVGVVGGAVAALDIDIAEDGDLALRIERLARERLGDTPALRIGKPPKRLLVYRTTEPFAGIRRAPLEVLCLGQQFVAYAEHPDTGQPYAWPDEGLADLDIESLPEIDADRAAAFLDEALALIPPEMRPKSLGAKAANGAAHLCLPAHAQAGTLAAIRSALAWLPNAELDYDSWMRIGMALKGALGEEGAALFAEWSAQAAKNDPAATAKAWASFKPARIGAGTIYHLAMEKGWRPDPDLLLDGSQKACASDEHPAAGPPRAARPARSPDADPPACAVFHADDSGRARGRSRALHDRHRAQTAAAPRAGREPLRPRRADGAALPHHDRPAHEPLHRRHRGQRVGQEPRPRGRQRAVLRGRTRAPPGRQQDRLRCGAPDRAPPSARHPVPDRRVRNVPLGGGRPQAQPAPHHRDPRQHDRALHCGQRDLPRRGIRQPGRLERAARHRPALPLRLRDDNTAAFLGGAAGRQRRGRLARPAHHPAERGGLSGREP